MTIVSSSALPLRWKTQVDPRAARAVVTVVGELDRLTAPMLHDHLLWVAATQPGAVALDLSSVTFVDVGGHEVLRRVGRHFLDRDVPISLSGTRPSRPAAARRARLADPPTGGHGGAAAPHQLPATPPPVGFASRSATLPC